MKAQLAWPGMTGIRATLKGKGVEHRRPRKARAPPGLLCAVSILDLWDDISFSKKHSPYEIDPVDEIGA